ncbi:MAG TPA: glycosyltransferase family 1 protein, partial [Desulfobacterales bacterium]|nr:glycosyltransferase family 1 protein [Desulfobacterales bacterium]
QVLVNNAHILYILSGVEVGGAESYIPLLISGLKRYQYRITVLCPAASLFGSLAAQLQREGADVLRIPLKHRRDYIVPFILPSFDVFQITSLVRTLKRLRPDVVHINQNEPESEFSTLLAAHLAGMGERVVTTVHISASYQQVGVPLAKLRDQWVRWFINRFHFPMIFVSEASRRMFCRNFGVDPRRISVIYHGLPADPGPGNSRAWLIEEFKLPETSVIGGAIGRFHKQKGYSYLIRAVRKVAETGRKNIVVLFIGDGEERKALEAQIRNSGLQDQVRITGWRDDVTFILRGLDFFVLPSLWEGMPFALLEAMRAGLPAIVSDVDGNREAVIAGETALLVPPADPSRLADALIYLSEHADMRLRMGAAARRRFEELFTLDRMGRDTRNLYQEIIRRGNPL